MIKKVDGREIDQKKQKRRGQSNDEYSGIVVRSSVTDDGMKGTKLQIDQAIKENRKKPKLHRTMMSDDSRSPKTIHSIQQDGIEPQSRGRSKVIFSTPNTTSLDQQRRLPSNQEDAENIASIVSHVAGRFSEGSVASDVSGLTDGEFFKTDDVSNNLMTSSKKCKNFRSVVRAPEPPKVPLSSSKLNDIQSEATSTTVSSSRDERLAKNPKKKRSVSFSEVQIRNYERILEVHPSVTSGPAIGIGWNYSPDDVEIFSLEYYEEARQYSRCDSIEQLVLPRGKREHILRSWGYSQREIAWSVRTILRSKNQRKQTIQNLHSSSVEEFMEKATRKIKYVLLFPLNTRKKAMKNFESPVLRKSSLIQPSAA